MNKLVLLSCAILIRVMVLHGQNKPLLYDFYEIPQSLMLNPGVKTPYKWHLGVPLLSNFSLQVGVSGVSLSDIFSNDGIDFTTKLRENAVNRLRKNDEFGGSGTLELINVGLRSSNPRQDYFSFGMYVEGFLSQFWPEDLAVLAFEGNANNLNRRFSLNHLAGQGEAVSVFHLGINRKINNSLTIGARAKLYSSIFEYRSANNDGYFVTTPGENNILRNTLVADFTLRSSGLLEIFEAIDEENIMTQSELASILVKRSLLGGNLGVGFDVGFTRSLGKRGFITASLLDVGFIYHNNAIRNYTLQGAVSNEGIEIVLPEDLTNFSTEIWEDLIDEIEGQVPFARNSNAYFSLRPIKLNTSLRYNWGEPKEKTKNCECSIETITRSENLDYVNAVGGHLFLIHRPRGAQAFLTGFYQRRFGNVLALKTTYTLNKYSFTNIGLGVNLQTGPLNFYLLADNVLSFANLPNSNYLSLQFGFNIISWNGN